MASTKGTSSNDCSKSDRGFSTSDMVLTGCLSFIAGLSLVLIFFIIMKWKSERRMCFKEKEEPFRGKWEGASNRATMQVLKKHTLERSHSDDKIDTNREAVDVFKTNSTHNSITSTEPIPVFINERKSQNSTGSQNETISSVTSQKVHTSLHIKNNDNIEAAESCFQNSVDLDDEEGTSKDGTETADESTLKTTDPSKLSNDMQERSDDGVKLTFEIDDNIADDNEKTIPGYNANQEETVPTVEIQADTDADDVDVATELSPGGLKADHLFEHGRDSSVYDHPELIIHNDNFRISVISSS